MDGLGSAIDGLGSATGGLGSATGGLGSAIGGLGSPTGGDPAGTRETCGASAAGASPCDALPSTIFAPRPRSSTPRPPGFSRCHTSQRNFMSSGRPGGGGSAGARSRRGAPGARVTSGSDDDDDSGNAENDPLERSARCLGEKPSLSEVFDPLEVGPATSGSFSEADSTRSAPPASTADGNAGAKSRATLTARARGPAGTGAPAATRAPAGTRADRRAAEAGASDTRHRAPESAPSA